MKKILSKSQLLFTIFCVIVLALTIRGIAGNPTSKVMNNLKWKDDGPFELSPERGKFALTYSLIEDHSFYYSLPVARFATPDLGYIDGKYVSLFAPGLSFLTIPGYVLGKTLGMAQVGTYAVISLFALLNALLLRSIAIRLGAHPLAATLGATVFIFATPAFAYAVSLYQHHISTFLILLSIYVLLRFQNILSLALIWFLIAASIPIDYPNFFLMFPIGLYVLGRIINVKQEKQNLKINIKLAGFLTLVTVLFPVMFFLWFNQRSYGNPFQLAGTVAGVKAIDERGKPTIPEGTGQENIEAFLNPEKQKKSAISFFQTRNLLNGFYIHFFSLDRGILIYTPVVFLGILGMFVFYKKNKQMLALLLTIIGVNILLYSMWGDPYGGWAFASRYLIPSYALMSIFTALSLTIFRRNFLFILLFLLTMYYSVWVNALGAITSSRNPPKVEAIALEKISGVQEKYTYTRNLDYLRSNRSKSLVFQTYTRNYIQAWQYYLLITALIMGAVNFYLYFLVVFSEEQHDSI